MKKENENTSLVEGLFQNILQIVTKIPQLLQPNKKLFGYIFVITWITLLVLSGFQVTRWIFGMQLHVEILLFYLLIFFVLVLTPMLISMFNEYEKRNNSMQEMLKKILEEKEAKASE
ncbi:MAG: hypothetical protein ACK5B9_12785 [Flavobacteriia bacterium]|jgi:uncharacterized membrane protein